MEYGTMVLVLHGEWREADLGYMLETGVWGVFMDKNERKKNNDWRREEVECL